jgi:transcriptional regulator with GAF, ATPase, and Fis domain
MQEATTRNKTRNDITADHDGDKLHRQLTRNWYFLGAITVVSSIGLALSLAPMLEAQLAGFWPWGNTNVVLLAALAMALTGLVGYLTYQQRKIVFVRRHINRMEAESHERSRRQKTRLQALLNVSRMMGAVTDPENMFQAITDMCLDIFECQQSSLMILSRETQTLEVRAATGHDKERLEKIKLAKHGIGEGISGWVAEHKRPVNLAGEADEGKYPGLKLTRAHLTAAMVVPIVVRDELVGVLSISSVNSSTAYTEEDLEAMQVFAESAGTCIRHSERAKWMRQLIESQKGQSATGVFEAQPKPSLS